MATWLNDYHAMKAQLSPMAETGQLSLEQSMLYQELLYRIEVLETCQMLCKTAPVTTDLKVLAGHYQLVDAYMQCLGTERRFGTPGDDRQKASRRTAAEAMGKTVADCRKRFSSFRPSGQEQYKRNISTLINTVLPVWLQMRNAYTKIGK